MEPSDEKSLLPEAALWGTVLIWASTFIAMKDAFSYIDPLAYTASRFFFIVLLAMAVMLIGRSRNPEMVITPRREDLPRFFATGVIGYTCYQLGSVLGLDRSTVFTMSLLIASVPLITMAILAVRREPVPPYGWLGLGVAVAGVVLFLQDRSGGSNTVEGVLLVLGAALSFSIYGLINRPLVRTYPAPTVTAWGLLIGTVPLLVIGAPAVIEQTWSGIPARVWIGIAYTIVFPVYVAYQLWNYGIRHRGAAAASSYGLIVPILSGVLSALILNEPFTALKIAGAAMVLGGVLILRVQKRPKTVVSIPKEHRA